jgi:hypothetical protein
MEQLKLLMDYTVFHVGVYISLSTGLVALLGLFPGKADVMKEPLIAALACFLLAGACGGVIAAHIPYATDFRIFHNTWIGFLGGRFAPARVWMLIEHTAFWAGVGCAIWGLARVIRIGSRLPMDAR